MAYVTNIDAAREEELREWNQATADDDNSGADGTLPEDDVPLENYVPSAAVPGTQPDQVEYNAEEMDTGMNSDLAL